jgi:hypothetical protein
MRTQDEGDLKCDFGQRRVGDDQQPGRITGGIREGLDPARKICRELLEAPILLLLAQHRSFRICRREFFCPIQDYLYKLSGNFDSRPLLIRFH